jgi:hypothetical protein
MGVCVLVLNACVVTATSGSVFEHSASEKAASMETTIQIEILSVGRGVPDDTMRVYQDIKGVVKREIESGADVHITETVLGLEGERRMCIVANDAAQAKALYEEISLLVGEIELIRVSRELCNKATQD